MAIHALSVATAVIGCVRLQLPARGTPYGNAAGQQAHTRSSVQQDPPGAVPGEGRTTGTHLPWMCDLTSWVHFKPSWWGQIG